MVLPVGVPDGEAVGEEVGGDALREEEEVDDVQVHVARHVGGVPDEVADEREERKPEGEDDERDEVVDLSEEAHEPPDLYDVADGDRLVEAVADGGPDAELGEGEEAEDVPEEPVDAEVTLGEEGDERRAVGKAGDDVDDVAERPDAGRPEHARRAALAVEGHGPPRLTETARAPSSRCRSPRPWDGSRRPSARAAPIPFRPRAAR